MKNSADFNKGGERKRNLDEISHLASTLTRTERSFAQGAERGAKPYAGECAIGLTPAF